ncbi:Formyltetrahydrofolate deformylase 1, mitochondrial [Cucurbita argyrosperma subsp. argyrosperma]|nr:Formyltetrahydrofolate deformylase 1, mitochondrial [Cucurbita argyrosperma subsp. argyrosperma]
MALIRRVSSSFPRVVGFGNRSLYSLNSPCESLDYPTSSSFVHGIHVFHCPDAVGIVAKLSECIASRGGNILNADVFVPENKSVFHYRSQFLFDPRKWPRMQMDEDFLRISKLFNAWKSVVRVPDQDTKYKIAILASKHDHCLVDLLHQWQRGNLPVEITCVVSNHERAPNTHVMCFLERHGIAYHYLQTYSDNKREGEILELVKNTDFLVLARYMQVERVSHRDNLQSFVQKSENLEKQCLTNAIKSYCELRVLPYEKNRTVVF